MKDSCISIAYWHAPTFESTAITNELTPKRNQRPNFSKVLSVSVFFNAFDGQRINGTFCPNLPIFLVGISNDLASVFYYIAIVCERNTFFNIQYLMRIAALFFHLLFFESLTLSSIFFFKQNLSKAKHLINVNRMVKIGQLVTYLRMS